LIGGKDSIKCIACLYIQDSGKLNFGNCRNNLKWSSI
jgi:hypothetical protein